MDGKQEELDKLEELLAETADDMDSQELEDFMAAVDELDNGNDDAYIEQDADKELIYDSAQEQEFNMDSDMAHTMDGFDNEPNLEEESEFADLVSSFTQFGEEEYSEDEASEPVIKKLTLFQRVKGFFHKKELTEDQKQQIEMEEEEERKLEEQVKEKKAAVKLQKQEKIKAKKEAAAAKKREKQELKSKKAADRQEAANKKKNQKGPQPVLPKVSVKPAVYIVLIGLSLCCFFLLFINTKFYRTSIESAKSAFVHEQYANAYSDLLGLELKKEDRKLFEQAKTVRMIQIKEESYGQYMNLKKYPEALKSLISGVEKYEMYKADAEKLGVHKEFESIYGNMKQALSDRFAVSIEEAKTISGMRDKEAFNQKISELAEAAASREGIRKEAGIQQTKN